MKRIFLAFLFIGSISHSLFAQEEQVPKQREVGLLFMDFDQFGLTYRTGTESGVWRIQGITSSFNKGKSDSESKEIYEYDYVDSSYSVWEKDDARVDIEIQLGYEKRTKLAEKVVFRYGLDLNCGYKYSFTRSKMVETNYSNYDETDDNSNRKTTRTTYSPGINFVIGFNVNLSENLIIGAEILPYVKYSFGSSSYEQNNQNEEYYRSASEENGETNHSGLRGGIFNETALLSLAYSF